MSAIEKLKGRGRSLYLAVKKSPYSNKEAAKRAGYKENTFYSHIKQEDLDFVVLAKYGIAIKHDFSIEYPEMDEFFPIGINELAKSQPDNKEFNILKDKYLKLLESHKELLDRYNELQMKWYEITSKE